MSAKTLYKKAAGRKSVFWGGIMAIIAACCLVIAPPLLAQQGQKGYGGQQQQGQEGYGGQQQPTSFKQEDLKKFAEVEKDITKIRKEYSNELDDVDDPTKARKIQDKYTKKMINAIKKKGLSVSKYNKISRAAQDNPEIRKKLDNMSN